MTIREALLKGINYLKDLEYTNPIYESRKILAELLEKDFSYLIAHDDEKLNKSIEDKYFNILEKRKEGYPLQYILACEDFYGRRFDVLEDVLIPRQDTELSIEVLLDIIKNNKINNMLEIGCGTGIVSITIDLESDIDVTGLDISPQAIKNTTINKNKFNSNIKIIESDLFDKVNDKFDIIYSNPPYIKTKEIENLQVEVREHEPRLALDGGEDGLVFYRKIVKESKDYLKENGFLIFEIGYDEGNEVLQLMKDKFDVKIYKDLNNFDRVVVGRLKV
ncbi:Release factor glutamine methyltransferase [Peptoniphilus tyrrelliae]|nr:Release factor glutamine methyltransferase [Peptoniphilus tyrrelliae]